MNHGADSQRHRSHPRCPRLETPVSQSGYPLECELASFPPTSPAFSCLHQGPWCPLFYVSRFTLQKKLRRRNRARTPGACPPSSCGPLYVLQFLTKGSERGFHYERDSVGRLRESGGAGRQGRRRRAVSGGPEACDKALSRLRAGGRDQEDQCPTHRALFARGTRGSAGRRCGQFSAEENRWLQE